MLPPIPISVDRAKRVTVTPKGIELLEKCRSITQYVNAEIMSGIRGADVHCAEAVLQKMKGRLIVLDGPRESTDLIQSS